VKQRKKDTLCETSGGERFTILFGAIGGERDKVELTREGRRSGEDMSFEKRVFFFISVGCVLAGYFWTIVRGIF